MEPKHPYSSRSNVNNRPPRHLIGEEAIDLFQSLEDEKTRLMWTESDESRSRTRSIVIVRS